MSRTIHRAAVIAGCTLLVWVGAAFAQGNNDTGPIMWAPSTDVGCTVDAGRNTATYLDGSVKATGFFYRPTGTGPFPAVLVLHTRGGLSQFQRDFAAWLAQNGYVALAPDYFSATGVTPATYQLAFTTKTDAIREDLARGLDCLRSLPYVDPDRLGSVGFSMGGYFNIVLATRDDVKGVVNHYGAATGRVGTRYAFTSTADQVKASVLLLHGDQDEDVPYQVAQNVQRVLSQKAVDSQLVTYSGVGHAWDQQGSKIYKYDAAATADANVRTLAFLAAKLQPRPAARPESVAPPEGTPPDSEGQPAEPGGPQSPEPAQPEAVELAE